MSGITLVCCAAAAAVVVPAAAVVSRSGPLVRWFSIYDMAFSISIESSPARVFKLHI